MKNVKMPYSYTVLWVLVLVLLSVAIVTYGVYEMGKGRWQCDEWQTYTVRKCETDLDCTTLDEVCSFGVVTECVKEVWTKK